MTPIAIETTIRLPDVVSMISMVVVVISVVIWVKMTISRLCITIFNESGESRLVPMLMSISRHEQTLFDEKGDPRLVSYVAHDRISDDCRLSIGKESTHQGEDIKRLADSIAEQSRKIDQLIRCVTILAAGGKAEDC